MRDEDITSPSIILSVVIIVLLFSAVIAFPGFLTGNGTDEIDESVINEHRKAHSRSINFRQL